MASSEDVLLGYLHGINANAISSQMILLRARHVDSPSNPHRVDVHVLLSAVMVRIISNKTHDVRTQATDSSFKLMNGSVSPAVVFGFLNMTFLV